MPVELKMLGWSILLGFAYVFIAIGIATRERGIRWDAGNRDEGSKPLSGPAVRAARASANFLETFPFFAAAALAVVLARETSAQTALGAQIYVWARAAYLPIYIAGIPYLRTAVWALAFWGMLQVIEPLL